jgi:recombination associated protein RdgC
MWFNNLQLYRLTKPINLSAEALAEKLAEHAFKPCGSLDMSSYGWASPMGRHGGELVHATNGHIMICARKEEKLLPSSIVNEIVAGKAAEIEDAQGRAVGRKERTAIKDEVLHALLPKALVRSTLTFAYISPKDNIIIVNAASAKKAEELTSYLRGSLGSLGATPISLRVPATATLTQWVSGIEVPRDFEVEDECELRDKGDEGGVIRCKHQDLSTDEIQAHLEVGMYASKLTVNWQDHISCAIDKDLSIKRLQFSDEIIEQSNDFNADDFAAAFDNDFSVMSMELGKFIPRLIEVMGGENE